MKIKVYKHIVKFSKDGNEVEIEIKCKNRITCDTISTIISEEISRDSGISTEERSEEHDIFISKASEKDEGGWEEDNSPIEA